MKTKLFFLIFLGICSAKAQTTYDLIWERDFLSPASDLTIEVGDTVRWTWTDENHTVENVVGSSVETFTSGFMGPVGSVWSYTFTVVGDNDYFCGIHGADDMSGTITVEPALSVEDFNLANFSISPNPTTSFITLNLPSNFNTSHIELFNVLGEKVISKKLVNTDVSQIDLSFLTSGLYIIRINNREQSLSKRIVKL